MDLLPQLLAALAGIASTLTTQAVIPRLRARSVQAAEAAKAAAEADTAQAGADAARASADVGRFQFYEQQLQWAFTRINAWEAAHSTLQNRLAIQEERIITLAGHVDDLYAAIAAEPDGGKQVRARLRTTRPRLDPPAGQP